VADTMRHLRILRNTLAYLANSSTLSRSRADYLAVSTMAELVADEVRALTFSNA